VTTIPSFFVLADATPAARAVEESGLDVAVPVGLGVLSGLPDDCRRGEERALPLEVRGVATACDGEFGFVGHRTGALAAAGSASA
jgi:hypothetical protein